MYIYSVYLILSLCIRFPIFGSVVAVVLGWFCLFVWLFVYVVRPSYSATMFSIFSFCLPFVFVFSSPCPKTHSNMLKFLQNICNTAVDIYTLFTLVICYLLIIFYVCIYISISVLCNVYVCVFSVSCVGCQCVLSCPRVECLPKLFWF